MTNYNDGKWWGWNGGECPVHPETVVQICYATGLDKHVQSKFVDWEDDVVAFRVIKEHKEPREWWIYEGNNGSTFICLSETDARDRENEYGGRSIRVREVLPD